MATITINPLKLIACFYTFLSVQLLLYLYCRQKFPVFNTTIIFYTNNNVRKITEKVYLLLSPTPLSSIGVPFSSDSLCSTMSTEALAPPFWLRSCLSLALLDTLSYAVSLDSIFWEKKQ